MRTRTLVCLLFLCWMSPLTLSGQIDYIRQIQPIFDVHCVGCHGGMSGVSLESFEALMGSFGEQYERSIIEIGNPEQSPLYDKIQGVPRFGQRMPRAAPPLSAEEIELIRLWILQGATSVGNVDSPRLVALESNYPNPFNPSTVIRYRLSEGGPVRLSVSDLTGREVAVLVDRPMPAGDHRIVFNASSLSSGVYLYRLVAGPVTITRKMVLVR